MNFVDDKTNKLLEAVIKDISRISELDEIHQARYLITSVEEIINPIVKAADVIIPAGAFFGDEAKGKTTDAIAHHPDISLIARTNSGENAGHTVYFEGQKYVFHLAPSALFTGKINVIGSNCVMDPITFMTNEISQLTSNGLTYENLFVGNVSIVTPYHKALDALGAANSSTLKGISPVHSSKVRKKDLRMDDLFASEDIQVAKVKKDMEVLNYSLDFNGISLYHLAQELREFNSDGNIRIPSHVLDFLENTQPVDYLIDLYKREVVENSDFPQIADTRQMMQDTLKQGGKIILEAPQSYFLSNMLETHHSSSTSADTTAAGIAAAAGVNLSKYRLGIINVHKAPASSRVGNGANPAGYVNQSFFAERKINTLEDLAGYGDDFEGSQNAFFESIQDNGILKPTIYIDNNEDIGAAVAMAISSSKTYGEKGATTLKPRVTGMFDCVAHCQVNEAQGPYLTISAMDRGDVCDEIGLVVAYAVSNEDEEKLISNGKEYYHGDIIMAGDSIPNENVLYHCVPIVKVLSGWKETPIAADKLGDMTELPTNVSRFVSEIEEYTGAEVISIGNGPETDNLIYIKRQD